MNLSASPGGQLGLGAAGGISDDRRQMCHGVEVKLREQLREPLRVGDVRSREGEGRMGEQVHQSLAAKERRVGYEDLVTVRQQFSGEHGADVSGASRYQNILHDGPLYRITVRHITFYLSEDRETLGLLSPFRFIHSLASGYGDARQYSGCPEPGRERDHRCTKSDEQRDEQGVAETRVQAPDHQVAKLFVVGIVQTGWSSTENAHGSWFSPASKGFNTRLPLSY